MYAMQGARSSATLVLNMHDKRVLAFYKEDYQESTTYTILSVENR